MGGVVDKTRDEIDPVIREFDSSESYNAWQDSLLNLPIESKEGKQYIGLDILDGGLVGVALKFLHILNDETCTL